MTSSSAKVVAGDFSLDSKTQFKSLQTTDELSAAALWIREADYVLICGAAGMSIGNGKLQLCRIRE